MKKTRYLETEARVLVLIATCLALISVVLFALTYVAAAQSGPIEKAFHVTEARESEDRQAETDCYRCVVTKIVVFGTAWGTHHRISYQLECSDYMYADPNAARLQCPRVQADSDYLVQIGTAVCFANAPKGNLCYGIVSQREEKTK